MMTGEKRQPQASACAGTGWKACGTNAKLSLAHIFVPKCNLGTRKKIPFFQRGTLKAAYQHYLLLINPNY
jgi:hypothetical protein